MPIYCRFLQSFRLISIDIPFITPEKYKLSNIVLFRVTAYSLYCLQKPVDNRKSLGHLIGHHSPESVGARCYSDVAVTPRITSAETNPVTFHAPKN